MTAPRADLLRSILDANEVYAAAFAQADPLLLSKLAQGQSPRICWLGCSDSRVSAELSTGVAPGSIFVHRNVAQCFHEGDLSAAAAISYAVNVLKVEAIIVCGHTGCGGVKAAMIAAAEENKAGGPIAPTNEHERVVSEWIAPIKSLALDHIHHSTASGHICSDDHESYEHLYTPQTLATLTDRHVAETVRAVSESKILKDAWESGSDVTIHGWKYSVASARLIDLGVSIGPGGVDIPVSRPSSYAGSELGEGLSPDTEATSEADEAEGKGIMIH